MAKLIAHKAVELDKVKAARRKVLSQPGYLDQHYIAQPKFDGCFAAVFTSHLRMASRTDETVQSCNHIIEGVRNDFGSGWVVFGEVWHPDMEQSKISGASRRQSVQHPELIFKVFDVVSDANFEAGLCIIPYYERIRHTACRVRHSAHHPWFPVSSYNEGTYGKHEALRDSFLAAGGYDGLILRDPNAPWILGTGTGGEIIKSKRVLSFDLEVLGVNEGVGKMAGMAGTLTLKWKGGRAIEAGGMDYATRTAWFNDPSSIIGKIVEVEAMDYSTDGLLREPRIKSVRFDKEKADY